MVWILIVALVVVGAFAAFEIALFVRDAIRKAKERKEKKLENPADSDAGRKE